MNLNDLKHKHHHLIQGHLILPQMLFSFHHLQAIWNLNKFVFLLLWFVFSASPFISGEGERLLPGLVSLGPETTSVSCRAVYLSGPLVRFWPLTETLLRCIFSFFPPLMADVILSLFLLQPWRPSSSRWGGTFFQTYSTKRRHYKNNDCFKAVLHHSPKKVPGLWFYVTAVIFESDVISLRYTTSKVRLLC